MSAGRQVILADCSMRVCLTVKPHLARTVQFELLGQKVYMRMRESMNRVVCDGVFLSPLGKDDLFLPGLMCSSSTPDFKSLTEEQTAGM